MKKSLIISGTLVSLLLVGYNICAQESAIDYKQLITKSGAAIKQARSYTVKMEYKDSFTINSQENESNSAELDIAYISPDKFRVAQIINEGSNENLWDGWIVIGNDYYVLSPVYGWAKEEDANRTQTCKNNSPEGIARQLEIIDKEYKWDSITTSTKDGIEYFVIKYLISKESVNVESLPPELKESKISGTCEVWINKNNYLPFKQSSETTYYSDERNKGTVSMDISYSAYNDNKIMINVPVIGSKD